MSNNAKKSSQQPSAPANGPFDVKTVEALVALMSENDLSEIYLKDGSQHLRLRRGATASVMMPTALPVAQTLAAAPSAHAAKPADAAPAAAPKKNLIEIKSETVGTFYSQSKPGEPPFVKVGDKVTPTKVVGVVEVMKTFNEIQANCAGTVVEIVVENGKYVEFGEVLFRVEP